MNISGDHRSSPYHPPIEPAVQEEEAVQPCPSSTFENKKDDDVHRIVF